MMQNGRTRILLRNIRDYSVMLFGTAVLTAGVYFFKIPNGFVTGGVSGIGTVFGKWLPVLPASTWISLLNLLLLFVGFLVLGKKTGIKTVVCSLLFSLFSYLLGSLCPMEAPFTGELMLELIYAIILTSCGSALLFSVGASSGGTDIIALIIKKYTSLDTGKALLVSDFLIACTAFFSFGVKIGLYSVLGLLSKAFLVDSVADMIFSYKYVIVITDRPEEIRKYMLETMHHGVTSVDAVGEFTGTPKKMLHTVCHRRDAIRLKKQIREFDPHAFLIISSSGEILGKGFRQV